MVQETAAARCAPHLAGGANRPSLLRLVAEAIEFSVQLFEEIAGRDIPNLEQIACRKGCAWCCYQQVGVTPPQAIHIAEYVRGGQAEITMAEAVERLHALDRQVHGLTNIGRIEAARPCAFLDEAGSCTIYQVRPFACRGANSIDAEFCQRIVESFDDVRDEWETDGGHAWIHQLPYEAMARPQDGMMSVTEQAGLADEQLELTAAVLIALEDEAAADKWITGENVFAAARLPRP